MLFCFPDKIIRHRACTLKDTAHAIIAAELDPEFNKMCEEIKEARRKRGMFNFICRNTTYIGEKTGFQNVHIKI